MASHVARRAVIVGAGLGGLTAAGALAGEFERVVVLDGDRLPDQPVDRAGVPQGRHVHALLAGGQRALDALFPGFSAELAAGGAERLRVGLDIRSERVGFDPFPQRDLGWDVFAMSRAVLEFTVRTRVAALPNVEIRDHCRVQRLHTSEPAGVTGLEWQTAGGVSETLATDLVVDASGAGMLTLRALDALGRPRPDDTTVGVDLGYSTAVFAIPDDAPVDWKGVFTFGDAPRSSRGALLLPMEGRRWIVTVAGRHGDTPPGDPDGFMGFVGQLRTRTIHDAVARAKRVGDIARFQFTESRYRHFDRDRDFPRGLLPVGDAVCRFNPVWGQGVTVAAQEAVALRDLLAARRAEPDPMNGLATAFFVRAAACIDTPWAGAAIPDFVFPETRGERPANLAQLLAFGQAMTTLAVRDPAVHRLIAEVQHLLKPRSVYQDPQLVQRVLAVMEKNG